jgi:hypothetical protein
MSKFLAHREEITSRAVLQPFPVSPAIEDSVENSLEEQSPPSISWSLSYSAINAFTEI